MSPAGWSTGDVSRRGDHRCADSVSASIRSWPACGARSPVRARRCPSSGAANELPRSIPLRWSQLRQELFGDPLNAAAARLLGGERDIEVVVFGHTHDVGGTIERIAARKRSGWYANTGSWISAASVPDLRARGIGWDSCRSPTARCSRPGNVAVVVEYANGAAQKPVLVGAPPPAGG